MIWSKTARQDTDSLGGMRHCFYSFCGTPIRERSRTFFLHTPQNWMILVTFQYGSFSRLCPQCLRLSRVARSRSELAELEQLIGYQRIVFFLWAVDGFK